MLRLQDRIALITGGSAGIGWATAERFAEEGATVIIADLHPPANRLGPAGAFYQVDVRDRQAVQTWVEEVMAAYGQIDILVNNAGVLRDGQLVKMKDGTIVRQMSEEDFDLVVDVNLKGAFNCTQAVVPYMMRQGRGVILNAASIVGLDGNFGQTNYVATKAGLIGMTKVWARELGRYGVRVNAVAPGFTLTDMVRQMPQQVLDVMIAHTPLDRLGEPRDVANAYLFLASDEASFISGVTLRVDGGIVVGT